MTHNVQHFPRLVIAAPQGRSGKTTVSLGLAAAFRERGLVVQPYKKGPDYIDPSWLAEAAGRPCRSLDPFFLEQPGALHKAFVASAQQAGLNIIEGNHGLFDSFDEAGTGSTARSAWYKYPLYIGAFKASFLYQDVGGGGADGRDPGPRRSRRSPKCIALPRALVSNTISRSLRQQPGRAIAWRPSSSTRFTEWARIRRANAPGV